VPEDAMKLRLTSSIARKAGLPRANGKLSQIRKFVDAYPEFKDDVILLAISTGNLRFDTYGDRDIPIACSCVFGFGSPQFLVPKSGGTATPDGYQQVPHLTNSNGVEISMESFKTNDYDVLSGLLYANHSPFSISAPELQLIENPNALSFIPSDMSNKFTSWRYNLSSCELTRTAPR
jgi:hypothetical protein